jgi:hypothetical protein
MTKKSAVKWLIEQTRNPEWNSLKRGDILEKAIEMEKQQIVKAFDEGYENGACVNEGQDIYHGSNYYKLNYESVS